MKHFVVATLISVTIAPSWAAAQYQIPERIGTAWLDQYSGGDVRISRGLGAVSGRSSLELEWIVVTDSTLGVVFDGPVGAKGTYDKPWFRYGVDVRITALDSVVAFEARVITFNVWGEFTGTLSFTQLEDFKAGQRKSFDRVWGIYGESQLRQHFTSIAYIARVRFADGRTVEADPTPALTAAKAIQGSITLQDLLPRAEPIPSITAS